MKFEKINIETTKGRSPSKDDVLLPHFVNPGDSLAFDKEDMTAQKASNIAIRFSRIDPQGRKFHSFSDAITGKRVIRVRPDGEVSDKEENGDDEVAEEPIAEDGRKTLDF